MVPDNKHNNIYRYKVPNHRKVIKPTNYVRKLVDHSSPSRNIISRNLVLNEKNFSFEERIQEISCNQ